MFTWLNNLGIDANLIIYGELLLLQGRHRLVLSLHFMQTELSHIELGVLILRKSLHHYVIIWYNDLTRVAAIIILQLAR